MRQRYTVYYILAATVPLLAFADPRVASKAENLTAEIHRHKADAAGIISLLDSIDHTQSPQQADITIDELQIISERLSSRIRDLRTPKCAGPITPERSKRNQQIARIEASVAEIIRLRLEKAVLLWRMKQNSAIVTDSPTTQPEN